VIVTKRRAGIWPGNQLLSKQPSRKQTGGQAVLQLPAWRRPVVPISLVESGGTAAGLGQSSR